MKALTIHQPFAHLIVTPQDELPIGAVRKRIENRTWPTAYRGPLLIHAGKSLKWINHHDWPGAYGPRFDYADFPEFVFGAIVGVATLAEVIRVTVPARDLGEFNWIYNHHHMEGPWCWILKSIVRFDEPIPYRGSQGLFDVPRNIVVAAMTSSSPG